MAEAAEKTTDLTADLEEEQGKEVEVVEEESQEVEAVEETEEDSDVEKDEKEEELDQRGRSFRPFLSSHVFQ